MADCKVGSKQINLPNIWHCCDMKDYDLDNWRGNRANKQFVMGKGGSMWVKEMYQKLYKENTARTLRASLFVWINKCYWLCGDVRWYLTQSDDIQNWAWNHVHNMTVQNRKEGWYI